MLGLLLALDKRDVASANTSAIRSMSAVRSSRRKLNHKLILDTAAQAVRRVMVLASCPSATSARSEATPLRIVIRRRRPKPTKAHQLLLQRLQIRLLLLLLLQHLSMQLLNKVLATTPN